ncbi:MAG: YMGG-like glycine zipper-containing protein [Candidatus Binataceae bacterium]
MTPTACAELPIRLSRYELHFFYIQTWQCGRKKFKAICRVLFRYILALAGCSDTGIGAGVGAGGGALVGSAVGHPWIGALVGGAGGAVAGHEIGKSQNKNRDQQSDQE